MNSVKALACILLATVLGHCQADRTKIFGSLREVTEGDYPAVGWILIGIRRVKCGVVLIAPDKALTAASCITGGIDAVTFGDHDRSDTSGNEQEFSVDSYEIHPDYKPATYEYDVAILFLDRSATVNQYVAPIPLLAMSEPFTKVFRKHCRVVGWGYEVEGATDLVRHQSPVLLEVTVDMIDNATCAAAGAPTTTAICYEPYRDPTALTCEGDAGGAYMCKRKGTWTLSGIMSLWNVGEGCTDGARAATKIPAVYDWIIGLL